MKIDARLKNTVDHWIGPARQMCATEQLEDKIVQNEVLMFFAGLGLARIKKPTSDTPIWVAAKSSVENCIGDDLSACFERYFGNRRSLLPSLNIILAEMVEKIRRVNQLRSQKSGREMKSCCGSRVYTPPC